MNLLVLTNLYPPHYVGGYELHCQLVVNALQMRGHRVQVLTSDHLVKGVSANIEPHVTRALKIHGLFGHPFLNILRLEQLERHNNETLITEIERHRPDLVFVWAFSGLSKSMLHTLQRINLPAAFAVCDHWIARSQQADVWLNWWNRPDGSIPSKVLRQFWNITGKRRQLYQIAPTRPLSEFRFKRLYFCSRALREFTQAAGFPVSHGEVIYCPLDSKRFKGTVKRTEHPLQKLLYAGRLHEDKGVFTALRAMALVRNKFAGTLHIYGDGEPAFTAKLREFVSRNKLPVTFHKAQAPQSMPSIYREHDVLLFTSEWTEPFALTPLEAMASGLPVIGTTTGGSAELFRHGENALTFTAGSADELARRILELASNPMLREQIARNGQQDVIERFSVSTIIDQVESYLRETIETWDSTNPIDAK